MASWSRFQKLALLGLGAVGGGYVYYNFNSLSDDGSKVNVYNSWTTNYTPSVRWDQNWDLSSFSVLRHNETRSILDCDGKPLHQRIVTSSLNIVNDFNKFCSRSPESLVNKSKYLKDESDENKYNEKLESVKSRAVRHLILIRHGQYLVDKQGDKERILTPLGRLQADMTGKRLAAMNIKWDLLVRSTMTRAQETAEIIAKHLQVDLPVRDCQLIEEGAPIPPEPPVGHWKPEKSFFQDSARIEAAFRKYFHRAPPEQTEDTYTILVCHANVIRFFVCKALQFPPEGWLRISLNHGSITWVSINPNGSVILRALGDTGHMDPQYITSR